MEKRFIFIIYTLFSGFSLFAQDSRNAGNSPQIKTSFKTEYNKVLARLEKFNNHPYNLYYDRLIVEYEERMKENVRKYRKIARLMKKPQYSDPSYFGHKRKPKKRPVGKRKYCKECEIVH
jgi:hypothetical protein